MATHGAYHVLCMPKRVLWRSALLLRLIKEEFEAQRGYVTCPSSQIQRWVCWNFSLGSVRHESHSPPCPIASHVRLTSGDMDLGNKELGVAFLQPGIGNQWWEHFPGPLLVKSEVGLHVLRASCIKIKPNKQYDTVWPCKDKWIRYILQIQRQTRAKWPTGTREQTVRQVHDGHRAAWHTVGLAEWDASAVRLQGPWCLPSPGGPSWALGVSTGPHCLASLLTRKGCTCLIHRNSFL